MQDRRPGGRLGYQTTGRKTDKTDYWPPVKEHETSFRLLSLLS